MKRDLAKALKSAGFPVGVKLVGHMFYPDENNESWSAAERERGVVVSANDIQNWRHLGDEALRLLWRFRFNYDIRPLFRLALFYSLSPGSGHGAGERRVPYFVAE
jgi:hypothetical protein